MSKYNINYGIDLGTTNSSIARAIGQNIDVIQIGQSFILPSCVHFKKSGERFVGMRALDQKKSNYSYITKNTFSEFKNNMGEDIKYHSSHANKDFTPEDLSSFVLRELKQAVKDENFNAVVVTVPADFDQTQIDATKKASELAGFDYCELLQEPIAASVAYLNDNENLEGTWLVFDFGGGTFDAALVRRQDGIMKVIDTMGDNNLGGKNLDEAIVEKIIFPYLQEKYEFSEILSNDEKRNELKNILKYYAEQCKKDLTDNEKSTLYMDNPIHDDNGELIDLEIEINRSDFNSSISEYIDRAISICNQLLKNNGLKGEELQTILPVGGPTYIPYIRDKIGSEISLNIDYSINPMTAVSAGAATYASTRIIPEDFQERDLEKLQVKLGYPTTTAENFITLGVQVEYSNDEKYSIKIDRTGWGTSNVDLDGGAAVIKLQLEENVNNDFQISMFDGLGNSIECDPSTFSILQGTKISDPPSPHDVGVSAVTDEGEEIFIPIIKKGTTLPTKSKKYFTIKKDIRPTKAEDFFKVILWEGEHPNPIRNRFAGEMKITGEDVASLVPSKTKVEISLNMDQSRTITASAYIDYTDDLIEKVFPPGARKEGISYDELNNQISAEMNRLKDLDVSSEQKDVILNNLEKLSNDNNNQRGSVSGNNHIKESFNDVASKIDNLESGTKWPIIEEELDELVNDVKHIIDDRGTDLHAKIFDEILNEVKEVKLTKNIKMAQNVIMKFNGLRYEVLSSDPRWWVGIFMNIKDGDSNGDISWKNSSDAEVIIEQGSQEIANGDYSNVQHAVQSLWQLMPETEKEKHSGGRDDILGVIN